MKKVLTVFGTRPEAIKMAPVIKELEMNHDFFISKVCVTGQHKEMLYQVLDLFNISPDYDLRIMKSGQGLSQITSNILTKLDKIIDKFRPDILLVHGDTTSALSASLSAFYHKVKIAHVEAGLRSGSLYSPWPEEGNRAIIDRICDLHFAPTELNLQNLLNEGIDKNKIFVTGNTVIDSLKYSLKKIESDTVLKDQIRNSISNFGYQLKDRNMVLITCHRRENFGQGISNVVTAVKKLSLIYPNIDFVFPVHLNPNIQSIVKEKISNISNVFLLPTLDYFEFIFLMEKSQFILTDSGGIQEEAFSLQKNVLLMRDSTERPEAISQGTVKLIGSEVDSIVNNSRLLIDQDLGNLNHRESDNQYGAGDAALKICEILKKID